MARHKANNLADLDTSWLGQDGSEAVHRWPPIRLNAVHVFGHAINKLRNRLSFELEVLDLPSVYIKEIQAIPVSQSYKNFPADSYLFGIEKHGGLDYLVVSEEQIVMFEEAARLKKIHNARQHAISIFRAIQLDFETLFCPPFEFCGYTCLTPQRVSDFDAQIPIRNISDQNMLVTFRIGDFDFEGATCVQLVISAKSLETTIKRSEFFGEEVRKILSLSSAKQKYPRLSPASIALQLIDAVDIVLDNIERHASTKVSEPTEAFITRKITEGESTPHEIGKPLPKRSPERWPTDPAKRRENPAEFATRVYRPWMDAGGLTRQDLKRLDPLLFSSLENWEKNNRRKAKPSLLPDGFHLLTIEEANNAWIDRIRTGREQIPTDPDGMARLGNALRSRALEADKSKRR